MLIMMQTSRDFYHTKGAIVNQTDLMTNMIEQQDATELMMKRVLAIEITVSGKMILTKMTNASHLDVEKSHPFKGQV